MARLPVIGSDADTWGALLNEFLRVSHDDDGTLKAAFGCVPTLATLKGLIPKLGQCVLVEGYYTPGDGGGGSFYWDASASDAENGGTVIVPASSPTTGRWKRLVDGPLSVKWFGAMGDGAANDANAIQQTIAALPLTGGVVWFPPGRYRVRSSVVVSGTKPMEIRGYGAQLETDGAIYALTVFDAGNTVNPIVVAGLTINQRLNTTALGAILVEQSWNVRLRDITVIVDGSSTAYVGAIVVQGSDPANNDTGSFWTRIENAWIRKLGSGDNHPDSPMAVNGGFIPAGIVLRDSANATVISGGGITFARDAILITTRQQHPMSINAVLVEGMAFEYCEKAVTIDGQGANTGGGSGIRIIGCRGEELTTFLEIKNRTIDFATAPALFGNYLVFSVKNYIVKPAGISTFSWDFMLTPDTGQMQLPRGLVLNQYFGADMPLTINAGANSNRGLSVLAGVDEIFDVRANRVGATDIAYVGSARWGVPRVAHIGVRGLSSTPTGSTNLRGAITILGTDTTAPVSFDTAEVDATYYLIANVAAKTPGAAAGSTRVYVTDKQATGFTVNLEAAPGVGESVTMDWILIR